MSEAHAPRLAASESITATFRGAMYAPAVPLLLLFAAIRGGVGAWTFFALLLLLVAVAGLALTTALAPDLKLYGNRLEVCGPVNDQGGPSGAVNLAALTNVKSVSTVAGRVSFTGPSVLRSLILLEDAYGGRALFPSWGWTPKRALQTVLREAALDTGADIDEMSYWRLGFRNSDLVKVSPLRRFF